MICPCCGHAALKQQAAVHLDQHGQHVAIGECTVCGALTGLYGPASVDTLDEQVRHHTQHWASETAASLQQARDDMGRLLKFHRRYLPDRAAGHAVLDIGCGRGNLLAALLAEGYTALGCEPSEAMVLRAREVYGIEPQALLNVSAHGFLDRIQALAGQVDAVFLWHVLEHMPQPMALLQRLHGLLKPGGALICQGPMLVACNLFPQHLFLHTEANIRWIAQTAGFQLAFIDCAPSARGYASFVLLKPLQGAAVLAEAPEDRPRQA
jgi:2-polyprenyl-3-methyl-5-hydroxy-6-metoxy-1,4-benzoquinol methylase